MLSILWKYNVINVNEEGCYQQKINGGRKGLIESDKVIRILCVLLKYKFMAYPYLWKFKGMDLFM